MSENVSGFQKVPGGTKMEHWEVNGLTHVALFYCRLIEVTNKC